MNRLSPYQLVDGNKWNMLNNNNHLSTIDLIDFKTKIDLNNIPNFNIIATAFIKDFKFIRVWGTKEEFNNLK